MRDIHFVSGLPRAGSTLLCNILLQNPELHATQTSGMLDVLFGTRNNWDKLIEHKAHPDPACLKRVLKGIVSSYYEDIDKIVLDKSRGWTAYIELIEDILDKKVKILVPYRDIPEVLASMELLHRNTSKVRQPPGEAENYFQFQTQEGRCNVWLAINNLVGMAYQRITDSIRRGFRDRLHFINFDLLTRKPERIMHGVYDFLELKYYDHDFDNVQQLTQEDDELHGYVGLHKIRTKVEAIPSRAAEILGQDLAKKYEVLNLNV